MPRKRRLPRYKRVSKDKSPRMILQAKDVAILEDIYTYKYLTTSQIATLRKVAEDEEVRITSRRTVTYRLQRLYHNRFLDRIYRPRLEGTHEIVHILDREGVRILSEIYGFSDAYSLRKPSLYFLDHELLTKDIPISLIASLSKEEDVKFVEWKDAKELKEREGSRLISKKVRDLRDKAGKKILRFSPDGFFIIRKEKRDSFYFVEVDRSIRGKGRIIEKIQASYSYWREGHFQKDYGVSERMGFRMLFVARSKRRRNTLRECVKTLEYGKKMYWFSLQEDITPEKILGKIWIEGEAEELHGLVD